MREFLHVGCGTKNKSKTTRGFNAEEWKEVRLDIDESVKPDIVCSMIDMGVVEDGKYDALFSSHNIEHLYPYQVPMALSEFHRVLKDDGFIVITCPDLKSIAQLIVEDKLTEAAYESPAGPIAPIDVLYGFRPSLAKGNHYMAHRCGFTKKVLGATLKSVGFATVATIERANHFDLWAVASKSARDEDEIIQLAQAHFPS